MKQLIQQLEESCSQYQLPLSERVIFAKFITSDQLLQKSWEVLQNPINSVCGVKLQGELAFQCFTCSPDPDHVYCYSCFDISLHINHKCIITYNNFSGGCCDCGDEQVIRQEGFCNKHLGFSNVDKTKELLKIPIDFQNKVRDFIKACCIVYLKYIKLVKQDYHLYDVFVTQFYHFSEKWGIQPIKDVIDAEMDIKIYYKNFQKALYLHNMLFSMIAFLTNSRLCFVLLITTILQEQLTPESKQSIMEDILEYQVILETQGPYESYKLENIIYSFYANQSFKVFLLECYLKKYKFLWLVTYHKNSSLEKEIKDLLQKLKTNRDANIVQTQPQIMIDIPKRLKQYIDDVRKLPVTKIQLQVSEVHEQHPQFVSEKFLKSFMNNKNISNIFQMNSEIQDILNQSKVVCSLNYASLYQILRSQFEYVFFEKIAITQIQQALGENYYDFIHKSVEVELIKKFKINDFIITAYIESFSSTKPVKLDIDAEGLQQIYQRDVFDTIDFLTDQGSVLKTIQIGLNQICKSQAKIYFFKENLIKLILLQCYNIIKNGRNKLTNVDLELNQAWKKFIQASQDKDSRRLAKIYLLLVKSSTLVDKIFIFLLCYAYNSQQFKHPNQFCSYLLNLFQEDNKTLKLSFSLILSRCIQTFLSIQFCQTRYLEEVYLGLRDQKYYGILESFDTSFLRIYIFLFGIEGYYDFETIIRGKHLPDISGVHRLQSAMLLRLVSTDIDMYNVCGHMFEELPNDLKLSLAKVLQNFYNLSIYLDYTTIEERLISLGIQVTSNLSKHILQICELDKAVKKLKLKPEFKQIYDPAIFNLRNQLKTKDLSLLFYQEMESNGMLNNLRQIIIEICSITTQNFTQLYPESRRIQKSQITMEFFRAKFVNQTNYFRNQELKDIAPFLKEELKKIQQSLTINDDIQRLKVLIEEIDNCTIKIVIENQQNIKEKGPDKKVLNAQNKYRAKYKALQDSQALTTMIKSLAPRKNDQQQNVTENSCSSCKLNLYESEACAIILLSQKPESVNFQLLKLTPIKDLNNIDICITNCRHYYHKKCLVDQFEIYQKNIDQQLPIWIKLGCPVCKQASNFTLPLAKQLRSKDTEDFNSSLLLFLMESNDYKDDFFKNETQTCQLIIHTYYQLIFDLLIQLFSHPQEFARNEKFIIFQQIIKLLFETAKVNQQHLKVEEIHFSQQQTPVYQLLYIIEKQLVYSKNFSKYQAEAVQWLIYLICEENIIKLLSLCLEIPDEKILHHPLARSFTQINQTVLNYGQLSTKIQQNIIAKFGENFEIFYFRHFPLKCSICKFYNKNQKESKGAFVCLLCSQVFCQFKCSKTNIGNLNQHALHIHHGNSLYICLQTGDVTILSSPISISRQKCLYYNKLGQKINVKDSTTQWQDFVLDKQKVNELADIILNNTYQSIVRNLEVIKDQVVYHARL